MTGQGQIVLVKHLHTLLRRGETHLIDGIIGGQLAHPQFGALKIVEWESRYKNRALSLTVEGDVGRKILSSQWLVEQGLDMLRLSNGKLPTKLYDACKPILEAENRRIQIGREQEELRKQQVAAKRIAFEREQQAIQSYRANLSALADQHRDHILAKISNVVPKRYQMSIESVVVLASRWCNVTVPQPPLSNLPPIEIDPFLNRMLEYWQSNDLWIQMKLIRLLSDAVFFKEALELAIRFEKMPADTRLNRAIRVSKLRALSIAGFGAQAEKLGREMFAEQGSLDKYLVFTLWGALSPVAIL